ncbi:MAG: DNA methyltransferase, partial [Flavobacteriaceae bacterium]|nr:DNA methyltransferase [Flavobacteriaceae bacterium]
MEQKNKLAQVFHFDLYGKRHEKYNFLLENNLQSIPWTELNPETPQYFFVNKNFDNKEEYEEGFSVQILFPINSVGIVTARDNFTIHFTKEQAINVINEFLSLDNETARKRFELGEDVRDWSVSGARKDLTSNFNFDKIVKINYRPFDIRYTYFTGTTKGFHCMPRGKFMKHFIQRDNLGLVISKRNRQISTGYIFVTNKITDFHILDNAQDSTSVFLLYLYPEANNLFGDKKRKPNLNPTIVEKIAQKLGLIFTEEKENNNDTFAPIDLLDYIYAVLHSPSYRKRYKEFLKIDFPRIPYPENAEQFNKLAVLGEQLRHLHLMENITVPNNFANFPKSGNNNIQGIAGQARNDGLMMVWI